MIKKTFLIFLALSVFGMASAQEQSYVHKSSDGYEWPTDPAVLEKLD